MDHLIDLILIWTTIQPTYPILGSYSYVWFLSREKKSKTWVVLKSVIIYLFIHKNIASINTSIYVIEKRNSSLGIPLRENILCNLMSVDGNPQKPFFGKPSSVDSVFTFPIVGKWIPQESFFSIEKLISILYFIFANYEEKQQKNKNNF